MAAYTSTTEKHLQKVDHTKDHWTDSYTIGDTVPVSGIYKCQGCNKEITSNCELGGVNLKIISPPIITQ